MDEGEARVNPFNLNDVIIYNGQYGAELGVVCVVRPTGFGVRWVSATHQRYYRHRDCDCYFWPIDYPMVDNLGNLLEAADVTQTDVPLAQSELPHAGRGAGGDAPAVRVQPK